MLFTLITNQSGKFFAKLQWNVWVEIKIYFLRGFFCLNSPNWGLEVSLVSWGTTLFQQKTPFEERKREKKIMVSFVAQLVNFLSMFTLFQEVKIDRGENKNKVVNKVFGVAVDWKENYCRQFLERTRRRRFKLRFSFQRFINIERKRV